MGRKEDAYRRPLDSRQFGIPGFAVISSGWTLNDPVLTYAVKYFALNGVECRKVEDASRRIRCV